METKRKTKEEMDEVIECLQAGGVAAFPTDTVYGLGVIYDDEKALERLKEAKGRPENKPIPLMISNLKQIESVAVVTEKAKKLIQKFMPGAFTIILKKRENVPAYVTNGFDTIGIRMPDDDFILELMNRIGKPMLVTSANMSGMPTGTTFMEVIEQLEGRIDMVVKGMCGCKESSTIVDASTDAVKLIRKGPISEDEIMKIVDRTEGEEGREVLYDS